MWALGMWGVNWRSLLSCSIEEVLFKLSLNLPPFVRICLHILHIPYICLDLPGIERTDMELK